MKHKIWCDICQKFHRSAKKADECDRKTTLAPKDERTFEGFLDTVQEVIDEL